MKKIEIFIKRLDKIGIKISILNNFPTFEFFCLSLHNY